MIWDQNVAFLVFSAGILLLFCELIFPVKSIASTLGAIAVAGGAYSLWKITPARAPFCILLAAGACFVLEIYAPRRWATALTGVLLLLWGAARLVLTAGVNSPLALLGSASMGAMAVILASSARRARINKRQDLLE